MKNTFGVLVKTRKLWESGWAIGERKKKKNKEPRGNPDGKKKTGKKSKAGRLETRSGKDLSPQF